MNTEDTTAESGLPIPKYSIGDTVYLPTTETTVEPVPCPDCLGTKKWKVVTPAGTEMEAECQRCTGYGRIADLPKPERRVEKAGTRRLTIGQITASTRPDYNGSDRVRYMCNETGIGSGSVYNESNLYPTEEEALAAAFEEAAKRTAEYEAQPKAMDARMLKSMTVKDADLEATRRARWNAWYSYNRLKDDIVEALNEEEGPPEAGRIETLRESLDWEINGRDLPDIGSALKALREMLPDTEEVQDIFKVLAAPATERPVISEAAE